MSKTIIGLTGGIGAGKSRVLSFLKDDFGVAVIQADEEAKELERPGQPGYEKLVAQFGDHILDASGNIDSKVFAELIFSDPEKLLKVNEIIHPMTWKVCRSKAQDAKENYAVIEAALLCEDPTAFDEVWYVDTSKENRIKRLMENRGYTREKCEQMIAQQPSEEEFRSIADFIIDNNGSTQDIFAQLERKLGSCEKAKDKDKRR